MDPSLNQSQWEAGLLVFCLALSGVLTAAETALSALTEVRARRLVEEERRFSGWLKLWLDKPNAVLTTILIGTSVVNAIIVALATLIAQRWLGNSAVSIAVAVTVIALLIFGEITPKTFAKHHAERAAPLLMPLVVLLFWVLYPAVFLFTRFGQALAQLGGMTTTRTGPFVTEEDIAELIRLGHKEGVSEQQEGRMLASIFELGETLVREVMVPRTEIAALSIDATLPQVIDEVRMQGHSRMPVYDDSLDEVKGFFHTKDLLDVLAEGAKGFSLKDHLRPVLFVPELMQVSELLKLFQRKKTHLAVVVDEYGGTAGIVALEDVLEEIVGEIQDEFDEEEVAFRKLDDHRYVADGRAGLYELGEALGLSFPQEGGYETLGGFLISTLGRIPARGEHVPFQGFTFIIRDADEKRVSRIEIERKTPDGGDSTMSTTSSPHHSSLPPQPAAEDDKKKDVTAPHPTASKSA